MFFKVQALAIIPCLLLSIFLGIQSYQNKKKAVITEKEQNLKAIIDSAYSIAEHHYQEFKTGKLTEKEAQEKALDVISSMHYGDDGSEYLWVNDFRPMMLAHPKKEMLGKDLSDFTDSNGKKNIHGVCCCGQFIRIRIR